MHGSKQVLFKSADFEAVAGYLAFLALFMGATLVLASVSFERAPALRGAAGAAGGLRGGEE